METQTANTVVGLLMVPLALLGLVLAAGALDSEMYLFGLSLAGFSTVFGFGVIKRAYDEADAIRLVAIRSAEHG